MARTKKTICKFRQYQNDINHLKLSNNRSKSIFFKENLTFFHKITKKNCILLAGITKICTFASEKDWKQVLMIRMTTQNPRYTLLTTHKK